MLTPGSANISVLDFGALYNLSGATPTITLTNRSSGPNLGPCKFWAVITTPSGTIVHAGNVTTPDATGAWVTWVMPEAWPMVFYHVEWSGNPYTITLNVDDGAGHTYQLSYLAAICPPPGNNGIMKGNFAKGSITRQVKCDTAEVYVSDQSNYLYKKIVGAIVSQEFKMVYPAICTGDSLPDSTIEDTPYAYFPFSYNAKGYYVIMNTVRDYALDGNSTVRFKFKATVVFDVTCNMDLCSIVCGYQKLLEKVMCGTCDADLKLKLSMVNANINLALIAINSRCAETDLPALIEETKKLLGDCCCDDTNICNTGVTPSGS